MSNSISDMTAAGTAEVVARIRAYLTETGVRPKTLARECGLGDETLRHVFREDWNPRLETLRAVERHIVSSAKRAA